MNNKNNVSEDVKYSSKLNFKAVIIAAIITIIPGLIVGTSYEKIS